MSSPLSRSILPYVPIAKLNAKGRMDVALLNWRKLAPVSVHKLKVLFWIGWNGKDMVLKASD